MNKLKGGKKKHISLILGLIIIELLKCIDPDRDSKYEGIPN